MLSDHEREALRELEAWVRSGQIRYREDIRDGLESAPQALLDLFSGANTGKLIVKIADPEAAGT